MSLTTTNIEALLVLCQEGNSMAQLEVYNRYQQAMYNTALRIVKDSAEAEDVMQESFITAFAKLDTFKGTASFGSWLKRIVINNSIVQYRKSQRFQQVSDEDLVAEAAEEYANDVEDYRQVQAKQLLSCMDSIHDNYRQILTLHFIEGYDYEECCEVLDISYANCRTLISRAKESLRKKLAQL